MALDSNLVDLFNNACATTAHVDAMEAIEPPPRFEETSSDLEVETFACYWILTMAPAWGSTIYTFSNKLYGEISRAPAATALLRVAFDVLVREEQLAEHRVPDPLRRPSDGEVKALGIGSADATHVADAVGLGCRYLLTNDRRLRNRSPGVESRWGMRLRRPSEYLVEAVREGAPWTTRAPWPWNSIERISAASGA